MLGALKSWVRSKASLLRHQTVDIAGVTFPDLRIASFGCGISWTTAPFCMQLLDLSLSSAPIIWYSIPPSEQATFEQFTMQQASKHVYHHPQPLHRSSDPNATDSRSLFKQFVISPKDLVEAGDRFSLLSICRRHLCRYFGIPSRATGRGDHCDSFERVLLLDDHWDLHKCIDLFSASKMAANRQSLCSKLHAV